MKVGLQSHAMSLHGLMGILRGSLLMKMVWTCFIGGSLKGKTPGRVLSVKTYCIKKKSKNKKIGEGISLSLYKKFLCSEGGLQLLMLKFCQNLRSQSH
jgi:hypothetical protein